MNKSESIPNALTPEEFTGLKQSEPKDYAAGMPGLVTALKHVFSQVEPVNASKILFNLNQKNGIDCPGCAWPDPDDERSALGEYCENGAKAIAEEASKNIIGKEFFLKNPVAALSQLSDYEIGKKGRITQPMYLPKGASHYQAIEWDDAFKLIAKNLNELPSPNDAIFYTSGRTSNEAAYLYQLFIREYGTNNLPDCSNMCHESSGVALSQTVGIGKGSVKLEDFYETELILVIGQNPGTNHPRMLSALKKAKQNGAKIITINPLPEAGLISFKDPQSVLDMLGKKNKLTDIFLQVKINKDVALLKAILKLLWLKEKEHPGTVFDHDFIKQRTQGYQDYLNDLASVDYDAMVAESGVSASLIEEAAQLIALSKKIIACWAMGLTQHKNAVENIKEVVNLLLLKGSIAKPGAGTCPVRGHSNVQGDRTMGIYEKPPKILLDNIENRYGFAPPREHGYDTVEAIQAMHQEKGKVFIAMGGNFLSATPDTNYTAKALQNCKLTVHVSTKLNRSHLIHGDEALILPCLGRTDIDLQNENEQFVTVENSMGVVHTSHGKIKPPSEHLLSEPAIIARMAKATLPKSQVKWMDFAANYDLIRDEIEAVIAGFENYNQRVRKPGGFYLPNTSRDGQFAPLQGKAAFSITKAPQHQLADNELMMMTIRTHDQFNTTIYGLDDRYRGIFNERRVVLMNPDDIERLSLEKGQIVDLYNYYGGVERVAKKFIVLPYDIPKGDCATYFPETNILVPIDSFADGSQTPTSKSVIIQLKKNQES